jgi:hypothetical protein
MKVMPFDHFHLGRGWEIHCHKFSPLSIKRSELKFYGIVGKLRHVDPSQWASRMTEHKMDRDLIVKNIFKVLENGDPFSFLIGRKLFPRSIYAG